MKKSAHTILEVVHETACGLYEAGVMDEQTMKEFNTLCFPKMHKSLFIAGTHTGIGKTFISAMLMSAAKTHHLKLNYFKPIQTGDDLDCETIKSLADCEDEHIIQPVYAFDLPATPYLAARAENKKVDHQTILKRFETISANACIVEGAGGLLSPICDKTLGRDLIKTLNIPLLVVASTTLGTMNHTLLTIEAAQKIGLDVRGIILSGNPYTDLVEVLTHFSGIPVLAEVPEITIQNKHAFSQQAATIFHKQFLLDLFS